MRDMKADDREARHRIAANSPTAQRVRASVDGAPASSFGELVAAYAAQDGTGDQRACGAWLT